MKKKLSEILFYLLLIQALFFHIDIHEIVICIRDDGHIAIEGIEKDGDKIHDNQDNLFEVLGSPYKDHNKCTDISLDWHFSNADVCKNKINLPNISSHLTLPSFLPINKQAQNVYQQVFSNTNKQTINTIRNSILLI